MTGAELRTYREYMGLTSRWLADYLNVDDRRVRRMEIGRERIPEHVSEPVNALYTETSEAVYRLVQKYKSQLEHKNPDVPVVMEVYRDEAEYRTARKHARFPNQWHRMVAARVGIQLPELVLDYATKIEMNIPPWEREEAK